MTVVYLRTSFSRRSQWASAWRAVVILLAMAGPASAQGVQAVDATELTKQLFGLFVVATVLESALTTLFNWRLYREFFNNRGVKTLVMIAAGYAVVSGFGYDVVAKIIGGAGGSPPVDRTWSQLLSALTLAGGSAAVFQLLKALGLRPPTEPEEAKPQPVENKAWVSVKVVPKQAVGRIRIHIEPVTDPAKVKDAKPALAGEIGPRSFGERLLNVFMADQRRLPSYGGRVVDIDKVYEITASAERRKADGSGDLEWFETPIYLGRFANRAVVDFTKSV